MIINVHKMRKKTHDLIQPLFFALSALNFFTSSIFCADMSLKTAVWYISLEGKETIPNLKLISENIQNKRNNIFLDSHLAFTSTDLMTASKAHSTFNASAAEVSMKLSLWCSENLAKLLLFQHTTR